MERKILLFFVFGLLNLSNYFKYGSCLLTKKDDDKIEFSQNGTETFEFPKVLIGKFI